MDYVLAIMHRYSIINFWFYALLLSGCNAEWPSSVSTPVPRQSDSVNLVHTKDIIHFWEAYDAIIAISDAEEQLVLLNDLYIDRGSPGLHAMIRARSYTSREYLQAINDYPEFWQAVRANTLRSAEFSHSISNALEEMKTIYPDGRDVPVYFVIGALRAGGTANDNKLLIGAELAMAGSGAPSHELNERLSHLGTYFENNPISGLIDLNLHEYVHTQQRSISGNSLLSQSLFEGVAEYVSTAAIGRVSTTEAVSYGMANHQTVIDAFESDILNEDFSDWIWNSPENRFGTRDLGYYVGYIIAEGYVANIGNNQLALKTLIELDYEDSRAVEEIVDKSGVFPNLISSY